MNRTDRLLAIVLELQAKGNRRAEDLARTFETSIRTIYRDIQALSESGVPIVAVPGQGYSILEGYFLPPLRFSTGEATMLLLGAEFVAQNLDQEYREAALSASRKIEAVLPESTRAEVRYLQGSILFVAVNPFADADQPVKLQQLRRAIIAHKSVRFEYKPRSGSDKTREADPYGLAFVSGSWYLVALDHARGERRHFRLDRMERLIVLPKSLARPANFHLSQDSKDNSRTIVVRARFDTKVARLVRQSRNFFRVSEQETTGGLVVTLLVRQESDVLQWLLSWGAHVHVLEPESLRLRMAKEAEGILQNHLYY